MYRLLTVVLAMMLTACGTGHRPTVSGEDVCAPRVDQALKAHGLTLAAMAGPRWYIDRFAQAEAPENAQPISGYRFYGRPPQCGDGAVVVSTWASCGVMEVRSVGGCRIEGMDHTWF